MPTCVLSLIYMCDMTWPPAPLKSCYLARNLKEVARACSKSYFHLSFGVSLDRFSSCRMQLVIRCCQGVCIFTRLLPAYWFQIKPKTQNITLEREIIIYNDMHLHLGFLLSTSPATITYRSRGLLSFVHRTPFVF